MSIHVFTMPFDPNTNLFHDDELQKFLLNKQVTSLRPEFFMRNGEPFWTVFIEYDIVLPDSPQALDELDEPQKLLYRRLREWRKKQAEQEGIPVYIIATNRQLLELVKQAPKTLEMLRDIRGFGKKKLERYGSELIGMIAAFYEKTPVKNTRKQATPKTNPSVQKEAS